MVSRPTHGIYRFYKSGNITLLCNEFKWVIILKWRPISNTNVLLRVRAGQSPHRKLFPYLAAKAHLRIQTDRYEKPNKHHFGIFLESNFQNWLQKNEATVKERRNGDLTINSNMDIWFICFSAHQHCHGCRRFVSVTAAVAFFGTLFVIIFFLLNVKMYLSSILCIHNSKRFQSFEPTHTRTLTRLNINSKCSAAALAVTAAAEAAFSYFFDFMEEKKNICIIRDPSILFSVW